MKDNYKFQKIVFTLNLTDCFYEKIRLIKQIEWIFI